ncbi:MAG TPA: PLP-dependent aminotransferase family protein [Candidatus Obscuribacterales bacterium]
MKTELEVNFNSKFPVHRQLSDALRRAIIEGKIASNEPLPSIRTLAASLGVSRSAVARSFEDLASQGYVTTVLGSGTFVRHRMPGDLVEMDDLPELGSPGPDLNRELLLSAYGRRLMQHEREWAPHTVQDLNHGGPPMNLAPLAAWKVLFQKHCRLRDLSLLEFKPDPFGFPPLREAYASYLTRARAVNCNSDQVAVFFARELRLDLLLRLFLEEGDFVAVENPGYPGARQRFAAHGANMIPIPVGPQGMDVDFLASLPNKIKFVYVTPSHHEPTGAVMPLSRRRQLLDWAKANGTFIIEDDYDSEYRYCGRPVPSLQGMDDGEVVIHLSCLWKLMSPVVKLGFLVMPRSIVRIIRDAKSLCERDLPVIDQFALTDFINEGHLERHIRRNRKTYGKRREKLVAELTEHLGRRAIVSTESAGMDMLVRIESPCSDEEIVRFSQQAGIPMVSSQPYYFADGRRGEFVIPFAMFDEDQIERGVEKLAFLVAQKDKI